ncbi:hypothetical protein PEPS_04550 [Persicobacter psychrovividus]|uniref:Uncharacterized protein n=1 Tax=Persicobacter psychrovividus TaxID=387638 RepID=A0ABN6L503_9BACT|nr:hypothetical protein PEPS_04550 [Persicobacter psychrovividus]
MYKIKFQSPKGFTETLKLEAKSVSDAMREVFRLHRVELHRILEVVEFA